MIAKPVYKNDDWEVYSATDASGKAFIAMFREAVQCGFASPANDFPHDPIDMNDLLIENAESTFIVKATGLSMTGDGIFPGNYLIIDRGRPYYPNGIAMCFLNNEFTIKRVNMENNQTRLRSSNSAYPDLILSEGDELIVWGMVTWSLNKQYGL